MAVPANPYLANLYQNSGKTVDVDYARNAISKSAQTPKYDTSNPFGFITNRQDIQRVLDQATKDSFAVKQRLAMQDLGRAENTMVSDRNALIDSIRRTLAGSVGAGNVGMGTVLQGALGTNAQNGNNLNMALQALQGIAGELQAGLAGNAGLAIDKSNTAKAQQGTIANEKYASDMTYASTALQALASLFWPGGSGSGGGGGGTPPIGPTVSPIAKPGGKVTPTVGQQKVENKRAWIYNGAKWVDLGPVERTAK